MDPLVEETQENNMTSEPMSVYQIIMRSGPAMMLLTLLTIFLTHKWMQKKKTLVQGPKIDPEVHRVRMAALRETRERQQREWLEASRKKKEEQEEKERKKREELKEKLEKYGTAAGGKKLGTPDDGYLPLSGGGATSSYKPPKRSACSKGGCGK